MVTSVGNASMNALWLIGIEQVACTDVLASTWRTPRYNSVGCFPDYACERITEVRCMLIRSAMTLAMANCLFGLAGCGGSGDSSSVAAAPVPPPPSPSPPPPNTYSVTVSWSVPLLNIDGTPLTDISGYRVSYGTNPANLTQTVTVSGAGITSTVIGGLLPGTYYFAVATLNSTATASADSSAASTTVP
jgi:hypothetical protein